MVCFNDVEFPLEQPEPRESKLILVCISSAGTRLTARATLLLVQNQDHNLKDPEILIHKSTPPGFRSVTSLMKLHGSPCTHHPIIIITHKF